MRREDGGELKRRGRAGGGVWREEGKWEKRRLKGGTGGESEGRRGG